METKSIMFFILIILLSCKITKSDKGIKIRKNTSAYWVYDSINEDKYRIEWGNSTFKKVTNDTFNILGNGRLEEIESSNKYIVLGQSTGTGATNIRVFLPLEKNKNELKFQDVLFNDLENETLVYIKDNEGILEVYNYRLKKSIIVTLPDLCPATDFTMCIDSIFLKNNQFIFQYQGDKWKANKLDNRVKVIELKY